MNFIEALKIVKNGGRVARLIWGIEDWVEMHESVLCLRKSDKRYYAWTITASDVEAEDWDEVRTGTGDEG